MRQPTLLLISQDPALAQAVREVARPFDNMLLKTIVEVDAAYEYTEWDRVALVIIHLDRPGLYAEVIRLIRMIQATRKPVATLVVGDYGDSNVAVTLLQLGVADYLTQPLDHQRLGYLVEALTLRARYQKDSPADVLEPLKPELTPPGDHEIDYSEDDPILMAGERLSTQVRRVAPQDATILLSGETGTGKTRLARIIHELSSRRDEPFLVVKCGGLSTSLIESELFGHVKGAFPGADQDRAGKCSEVGRGTLFLDEIDTLPPAMQAKLLRVVEDREFEVIGSDRTQPLQARLIAASNRSLEEEVAAGRFRSDLYYRLNVVNFRLPPLREHRASIAPMAQRFAAGLARRNGQPVVNINPATLRLLESYHWPGNLRELRNVVERAVVLCGASEILPDDLPDTIRRRPLWSVPERAERDHGTSIHADGSADSDAFSRSTLAQIKRDAELARISEALRKHSNNRLRAASELGISRMTLYKKLYKYGLMTSGSRHHEPEEASPNRSL